MGRRPAVVNGSLLDPRRYLKSLKCVWRTFRPEEVLPLIDFQAERMVVAEFGGITYTANCSSLRLQNFKRSLTCVGCGRTGVEFRAECNVSDAKRGNNPHLNLYAEDGTLMTHDHIRPVSRGGSDSLDNTQTMCSECNCRKADSIQMDPR
jgi:5-methylcytosine-specific restriction endonuclease McrA